MSPYRYCAPLRAQNDLSTFKQQIEPMRGEWLELLKSLKGDIGNDDRAIDYRTSKDTGELTPGMCVTIGFTPESEDSDASWSYQTGDNSFTGSAYSHPHWAVISLFRDSDCGELVNEIVNELGQIVD